MLWFKASPLQLSEWIKKGFFVICTLQLTFPGVVALAAEMTTDQLLNEVRASVKSISILDTKTSIDRKEKIVLLDIRDMKEFLEDRIQGAVNMSRAVGLSPRILEHHLKKMIPDKSAFVIVYCQFETRSPLTVKAMNDIGYSNVVYMKGGLEAWKKAGYPVVKK